TGLLFFNRDSVFTVKTIDNSEHHNPSLLPIDLSERRIITIEISTRVEVDASINEREVWKSGSNPA
ncbi:MAG: hypothetical protein ABW092_16760, partial [Candidatus Thiodiazotropha sp.]